MASSSEKLEKTRQGIMRMRELLDLMRTRLEVGEKLYAEFFAELSPASLEGLAEKEQQRLAAQLIVDDPSSLQRAALKLRFHARDLEKAFEELHDHFVPGEEEEEE